MITLELVPVPIETRESETQIRDVKDRPILRAAIEAKADVLLTGDKDFFGVRREKTGDYDSGRIFGYDELRQKPSVQNHRYVVYYEQL